MTIINEMLINAITLTRIIKFQCCKSCSSNNIAQSTIVIRNYSNQAYSIGLLVTDN